MADAHHHIAIHLLKPPIAVPGKARIAGFRGQCRHGDIIETKIEHRIHHARHRGPRTGAHRDQKRVFSVTQHKSHIVGQSLHCRINFVSQPVRKSPLMRIVESANIASHGKTRGHAQAHAAHFSQIGSFATQQLGHLCRTFGKPVCKCVDKFAVCHVTFLFNQIKICQPAHTIDQPL